VSVPDQEAGTDRLAYQALFLEGGLKKGQNVLIHAGASGVGVAAIQLARKLISQYKLTVVHVGGAANVFTTCGTDDKVRFLQKLGGEKVHVVNYKTQGLFRRVVMKTHAGRL
jgi:NADPH:quinone reductase-like Zn-dependent oxidoreductase